MGFPSQKYSFNPLLSQCEDFYEDDMGLILIQSYTCKIRQNTVSGCNSGF